MDPLVQAFAQEYGLVWAVVLILGGGFLARVIQTHFIPYFLEQQKVKREREERTLKAFEDNIRASVEHTLVVKVWTTNQEKLTEILNAVLVELKVLTAKKPRPGQREVPGD